MCGIVGYIGNEKASDVILKGLERLEYRGYDSCGITYYDPKQKTFITNKDRGRVLKLLNSYKYPDDNHFAIGHTRWATHGVANQNNSHPHFSQSQRFVIVHNGVIDNHKELVFKYLNNYEFVSDTDTEVIANLVEEFSHKLSIEEAIRKTISLLEGSFAFLIIDTENIDTLYAVKNKSPLLIGESKNGIVLGSDVLAFINYAESYYLLEDNSFIIIKRNNGDFSFKIMDTIGFELEKPEKHKMDFVTDEIGKAGYEHYMLKEISEQPAVIRKIMSQYMVGNELKVSPKITNMFEGIKKVYILAAGTSYHAGLIGRVYFEEIAKIPAEVFIASEFAYNEPLIEPNSLFVLISQSGETADIRSCLLNVKEHGFKTLTITNVSSSTLAREADNYLNIFAGTEIAVASTKAYVGQIAVLAILANTLSKQHSLDLVSEMSRAAVSMENIIDKRDYISEVVGCSIKSHDCFYIGRGLDYFVCLEAALKLKEITYMNTMGIAAGELKHGTMALIEKDVPVIAIISQEHINNNTRSNLEEAKAREATPLIISLENTSKGNDDIVLMDVHRLLSPLVTVIPAQLIAYYKAVELDYDVDKPRNLAKSATVE
ncbi:MAG: glutamine--fructose-6-phosphate transaminase (isomerizing) [Candidatus Izimaplasma sp.]|nr:glutamine--fructose-6-phosphate transaminase (isomerizing) [Candidatus Izimaplasma bacterium]